MPKLTTLALATLALSLVSGAALAQDETTTLRLGEAISRSIEQGGTHAYTLDLDESQFVYLIADQQTVDVVVTVLNPEGEEVGKYDGPARGGESVQFISKGAGVYRVEVTPFEEEAGEYAIELRRAEPKASTPEGLVEQFIAPYDDPQVPGGVVAVVRDGEIVFSRAFGSANLRYDIPWEVETRTNIGSTSKQFTAFAICLLAERGELSLDDDVRAHIPELPDLGETVTLRHLLTHTSGYREFLNTLIMTGRRLDLGDGIERRELIEIVQRQPELQNEPGAEWNYNNTGYGLLTVVIERVTGESFQDWMETNVFHPVGMYDTFVRKDPSHIIANSSQGYLPGEEGGFREARDLGGAMGAGGIYTTVADLAKWIDNLGSGAYGGEALVAQMKTPYILNDGKATGYGLGLFIDKQGGLARIHHGGADTAHRSNFFYYPELDAGVITQSNHGAFDGGITARAAVAFFEREMEAAGDGDEEEAEAPAGDDAFDPASFEPESFDAFAGRFEMEEVPGFILEFTREEGQYFIQATNQPRIEIFPVASNRFELRVVEASVEFHESEDGSVKTLTLNQGGAHPANRVGEEAWSPDAEALEAYAGRYYSGELETFYELMVEDDALVLKQRRLDAVTLNASKPDQFTGSMPIASAEFERDADGDVVAMLVSNGRTRDVRFEKVK